jgi:hypothetical protein
VYLSYQVVSAVSRARVHRQRLVFVPENRQSPYRSSLWPRFQSLTVLQNVVPALVLACAPARTRGKSSKFGRGELLVRKAKRAWPRFQAVLCMYICTYGGGSDRTEGVSGLQITNALSYMPQTTSKTHRCFSGPGR